MLIVENLRKTLKPILEDWCKKPLANEIYIYGIRRYLRGAWLSLHVDKVPRIISAILQVYLHLKLNGRLGNCKEKNCIKSTFDSNGLSRVFQLSYIAIYIPCLSQIVLKFLIVI